MPLEDAIDAMIDTLGTAEDEPTADDGKDGAINAVKDAKPEGDDPPATDDKLDDAAGDTQGSTRDEDGDGNADDGDTKPTDADDKDDRIAQLEKRYSNQSAEWTKEHERVQSLENEIELLKQSIKEPKPADEDIVGDEDFLAEFRKRKEEDPVDAMEFAIERQSQVMSKQMAKLAKDNETLQDSIANERLKVQEDLMRDQHKDYDDVIDVFTPVLKDNPAVMKKWQEAGGTAKAAYDIGLQIKEHEEFLKDPGAFKQKILDEANKSADGEGDDGDGNGEADTGKTGNGSTLSKVNSKGSPPKSEKGYIPSDPIDGVLNEIEKEQKAIYQRMR